MTRNPRYNQITDPWPDQSNTRSHDTYLLFASTQSCQCRMYASVPFIRVCAVAVGVTRLLLCATSLFSIVIRPHAYLVRFSFGITVLCQVMTVQPKVEFFAVFCMFKTWNEHQTVKASTDCTVDVRWAYVLFATRTFLVLYLSVCARYVW